MDYIEVKISEDEMTAWMSLNFPQDGTEYTDDFIVQRLEEKGVRFGIDEEMIHKMVYNMIYNKMLEVAHGVPATKGKEGYYEYLFDTNAETGIPKILPNGSVDYSNIIDLVHEGEVVARYHPAVQGQHGSNVRGLTIKSDFIRELQPLKCKGVVKDGNDYKAALSGRISLKGILLEIHDSLEIDGDVNNTYGNVRFNGNVIVHGDVASGMTIEAKGSITVDGTIEDAHIIAGEDVIVGNGIHGKESAYVSAGRRVTCNFIEQAKVESEGDVDAGSIVNSYIVAKGRVRVTDGVGAIIGGTVCGMLGVEVNKTGNRKETPTWIYAGAAPEDVEVVNRLRDNINIAKDELRLLEKEKVCLENDAVAADKENRKVEILKDKLLKNDYLLDNRTELEEKMRDLNYASDASVIVHGTIHKDTHIYVCTLKADDIYDVSGFRFQAAGGQVMTVIDDGKSLADLEAIRLKNSKNEEEDEGKKMILVVDDDANMLRILRSMLKDHYKVVCVNSGKDAIGFVDKHQPNVILLDQMMPELDGATTLRMIRSMPDLDSIPVVFLSGAKDKKNVRTCISLKPQGYLIKPVESEKLLQVLGKLCQD
ncbi:MAG: FapA family protein [Lachnospiraceae bacterium]|nr:FapA family protein [Lachnospiraceae bacterium]